ncbi:hypothetical protein [Chitinolyticbacter albus]|uniref:hypothetical protein n=1 Tax=Chitinolyticbacter albus TaxID=2961951 RepID=UPI00210D0093|nr:hypothetical protein [Chitinolyticbacter albus]
MASGYFDFNGDRKVDLAIWNINSGDWSFHYSSGKPDATVNWGTVGDIPVPAMDTH